MNKITFLLLLLISSADLLSQENDLDPIRISLSRLLNERLLTHEYQGKIFEEKFEFNMKDSVIIITKPMESLVGNKYEEGRNHIITIPFEKLHPQSISIVEHHDKSLLRIFARRNEKGFYDNISSGGNSRWGQKGMGVEFAGIFLKKIDDEKTRMEIINLFASFVNLVNPNIGSDEPAPKHSSF